MKQKFEQLKLKTKEDKVIAEKILLELVIMVKVFEHAPKSRGENRKWEDGSIFGSKYVVSRIAEMLDDPQLEKFYKAEVGWEEELEKFVGKKQYAELKKLHAEWDKNNKKTSGSLL